MTLVVLLPTFEQAETITDALQSWLRAQALSTDIPYPRP